MWKPKNCVSWLQEHYETDSSGNLSLNDMFVKYKAGGGEGNDSFLGKYVQFVFPSVKPIKSWDCNLKKTCKIYSGLCEREFDGNEMPFCNLHFITQWVPSPFFVCKNEDSYIQCAKFDELVNGNRIVRKISFLKNGEWEFEIGDSKIILNELQIDNTFKISKSCVQNIFFIVNKIASCKGKSKSSFQENETCQPGIGKNSVIEYVGDERNAIYRSLSCKRILHPISTTSTCRNCQFCFKKRPHATKTRAAQQKKMKKDEMPPAPREEGSNTNKNEDTDSVLLTESSNEDMTNVLKQVLPQASGEMLEMLLNQRKNLSRHHNGRRWDKKTISLCLSLWCRSRKNYQLLKDSKVLILPSGRTLAYYKSVVEQKAGFQNDMFLWMREEARKYNPTDGDVLGGVCIDEMSIQEDLFMVKCHGEVKLVGFVDLGPEGESMRMLTTGKKERPLATHVLQFLYIGLNGFRFPFACFPVTQAKAANLQVLFWEAVKFLIMYDFKVLFVSMDGAQTNRDFMKMFFGNSVPRSNDFCTKNVWSPADSGIIFMMDFSHVIKRVRNNISKSGDGKSYVRNLRFHQFIHWDHWINAYKWDRDTNAFPIHYQLSNDHLFLNQELKMRNKIAEDVLNGDMLHLMKCYQISLDDQGYTVDDTVALLTATSTIINIYRDHNPITSVGDQRLENLLRALQWFNDWENHVQCQSSLKASEKETQMISAQTREDINSCIIGFTKLCKGTLIKENISIVPSRINSDVIENTFCQQRGIINGNNTNPTFYQYVKNINTVIIGQNVVSKNSNAAQIGCDPLSFMTSRPIYPKEKRKTSFK